MVSVVSVSVRLSTMIAGADNEMKYDNLARSLAMMEDELKRSNERVKNAESRVGVIEAELGNIGENQKQLEISEEKARKREEKYQVKLNREIDINEFHLNCLGANQADQHTSEAG